MGPGAIALVLLCMFGFSLPTQATPPLTESTFVKSLHSAAPELKTKVLQHAFDAYQCALTAHKIKKHTLTIIDYSKPSVEPRLWVIDVPHLKILYTELVAHGKTSGDNLTKHFSNKNGSLASSLGVFVTDNTYYGRDGYSLRLNGLEPGFNDHARSRNVVVHGASYVSEAFAKANGRLGRSWGCPALPKKDSKKVIDTIKSGSLVFAYYPDSKWLHQSRFLHCEPPKQTAFA